MSDLETRSALIDEYETRLQECYDAAERNKQIDATTSMTVKDFEFLQRTCRHYIKILREDIAIRKSEQ